MWHSIRDNPPPADGTWIIVSGPMPWLPEMVRWLRDRTEADFEWGDHRRVPRGWFTSPGTRSRYDDGRGNLNSNAEFWMLLPTPPQINK